MARGDDMIGPLVDLQDPRTQRALLIAADSGQWLRVRTRDGELAYGVPSCRVEGRYYVVTATTCDCEDEKRHGLNRARLSETGPHFACKHRIAVSIFEALQDALADTTCQATVRQRRHLQLLRGNA